MILLPIGHEAGSVRRLPWVTFGLMCACVLGFIVSGRAQLLPRDDVRVTRDAEQAFQYYIDHPYLELDPEFRELAFGDDAETEAWLAALGESAGRPEHGQVQVDEQSELDRLTARALQSYHGHTLQNWGLIPEEPTALGFVAHMFLHGGWLHLLGNMLILYLAGPFIEDVWGRPLFAGFYIVAGLFAALTYIGSNPHSTVPMIGASGAISGIMGAFLIRYRKTRIRFFYLVGLFWRGTFHAPAWLMLPIWFGQQLLFAVLLQDAMEQVGGGVAHWAHIGGFAFGASFAGILAWQRIEERFLTRRLEGKSSQTVFEHRELDEALQARCAGDPAQAFRLLAGLVQRDPSARDPAAALADLARETGWMRQAVPLLVPHVEALLRRGENEPALELWRELRDSGGELKVEPSMLLRVARIWIDRGELDEARVALRRAMLGEGRPLAPAMALKIGYLAEAIDPVLARGAAKLALREKGIDPELERRARELEQRLTPAPVSVG